MKKKSNRTLKIKRVSKTTTSKKTKKHIKIHSYFTPSGKKIWTKTIGTLEEDFGTSISLDSKNNIYVTGHTHGSFPQLQNKGEKDVFLVKLDSFGKKVWVRQFGTPFDDYGNGLAIDSSDNISVTGFTFGGLDGNQNKGKADIFFVKFNSSGEKL